MKYEKINFMHNFGCSRNIITFFQNLNLELILELEFKMELHFKYFNVRKIFVKNILFNINIVILNLH